MAMNRNPSRALGLAISALVIAIFAIILILVFIGSTDSGLMMGTRYFPFWVFGIIITILIVMFIVRIIVWVGFGYPPYRYSRLYWQGGPLQGEQGSEQILDSRYARGEITREQYLQMQEDLRRGKNQGRSV